MLMQLRNTGLIVIGASITILMIGLAALVALPILIGAAALSVALAGAPRRALDRMRAETMGGPIIEGEWTVLDTRAPERRRRTRVAGWRMTEGEGQ